MDLIVINGRVETMDAGSRVVEAVGIRDGRIAGVAQHLGDRAVEEILDGVPDADGHRLLDLPFPEEDRDSLRSLYPDGIENPLDGIARQHDPCNHPLVESQVLEEPSQDVVDGPLHSLPRTGVFQHVGYATNGERHEVGDGALERADDPRREHVPNREVGNQDAVGCVLQVLGDRAVESVARDRALHPLLGRPRQPGLPGRRQDVRDRALGEEFRQRGGSFLHRFLERVRLQMLLDSRDRVVQHIFDDRVGLAAGRNREPFLLQIYRRDMGGGKFVLMKDLSAPITVGGRHWGGVRIAYKL